MLPSAASVGPSPNVSSRIAATDNHASLARCITAAPAASHTKRNALDYPNPTLMVLHVGSG
jgi:hypothetical protein